MSVHEALIAYPVILSGGSGTRLWPLSKADRPKQFLSIVSDETMMQETVRRVEGTQPFGAPIVVASHAHSAIVTEQLAAINSRPAAVLLEPEAKNTAAAIALAAAWILARHEDGLMLIMPSDHVIADVARFREAIAKATPAAARGKIVTFGIEPTHAETGYGYIERGAALEDGDVFAVARFVEKPPLAIAQEFVAGQRHYWNGGIFLFTARAIMAELGRYAPQIATAAYEAIAEAKTDDALVRPDAARFATSPSESIDYAVMEKTDQAVVVPVSMQWSDVGSWDALWTLRHRDADGNAVKGGVVNLDGRDNLVYVDGGPPVALIGMQDCVVVSTAEGILVMPRDRAQDVKKIVDQVKAGALAS